MPLYTYLKSSLFEEVTRWPLWLPVFFAIGIIIYFALPFEPGAVLSYLPAVLLVPLAISRRSRYVGLILFFIAFGFASSKFRAEYINSPVAMTDGKPITISGNIEEIDYGEKGLKVVLRNLRIDEMAEVPKKIRLTVRTKVKGDIKPGDRVITDAILLKPPRPAYPGGYDFARNAYFKQIGATGFAVKKLVKLKWGHEQNTIEDVRFNMTSKIWAAIGGQSGAVSSALITGERSKIDDATNESMRDSGLAHLLSISGLHLTLVVGVIFFLIRSVLVFGHFAERFSTKKIAAACAIVGGFLYLLISGAPVPAVRSFIMVAVILLAVILDRSATPMRSVAFAAFVIMLAEPESVLSPSFQMSFMAVAALIAGYEIYSKKLAPLAYEKGESKKFWAYKIFLFPATTIATSIIAGLATSPYSAYHFNQFANYGLVSNLLAIPITSFLVMPAAVVGVLLMPIGLEYIPLKIMGWGVDLIIKISDYVAGLDGASINVSRISDASIILISFGMIWMIIWQKSWRLLGLIPIIISVFITVPKPDILISETGKLFAINYDDKLYLSRLRQTFMSESWVKSFGQEEFLGLAKEDVYTVKGKTFSMTEPAEITFTPEYLAQHGTTAVYINGDVKIESVIQADGRPWNH